MSTQPVGAGTQPSQPMGAGLHSSQPMSTGLPSSQPMGAELKAGSGAGDSSTPRTTLIVCPLSVLSNWIVSMKAANIFISFPFILQ